MSDRREAKRIKVPTMVSFFGERRVTAGVIQDLSAHGARVLTEEALEVGDKVELKVDLPWGHGAFRALALVVWEKPSGNQFHPHFVGLEFVRIDKDELVKLEQFAAEHEEIPVKIH